MKIISYSDLHLEFGARFTVPENSDADILVLAGDIISLKDYDPLFPLFDSWKKPILYVTGNHEYYAAKPINKANAEFREWLAEIYPNVHLLLDEAITIDGVNFFGGTMWTNFANIDEKAMDYAATHMNDCELIKESDGKRLQPRSTVKFHNEFVKKLEKWFLEERTGPRVVITHHAPTLKPNSKYNESTLMPAFNSLDIEEVIKRFQPDIWIYGHTHEVDDQVLGKTRIISNSRGYPIRFTGLFECNGFSEEGMPICVGA